MTTTLKRGVSLSDYSLVGSKTAEAIANGLAEAKWYASPVPKDKMRELLERKDAPAIRDTIIWFSLLFGFGIAGYFLWGTLWAIPAFLAYGVIYASSSDSRWHESSHGTAFKTDWMNNVLYEIASFMVLRESTPWRWSHTRHHSDTIIVGRDPEIAVPRPPSVGTLILNFFNIGAWRKYLKNVPLHVTGKLTPEEATFIPASEIGAVVMRARIYALIYIAVIALALYTRSILPLMYIGLPSLYGVWLMVVYGYTQHAGLAENVLDHRLNCRTVYMNGLNRYLYWNMNYHVEHHMFPLVPYHALPRLHALIKADTPIPYASILEAYREIIPAVLRQTKDPTYCVRRVLPTPTNPAEAPHMAQPITTTAQPDADGWLQVCWVGLLNKEDVVRFDHNGHTYALYRTREGKYYATDGICTHGNAHLADGLVMGNLIECAKHNGRFDLRDGSPQRPPVCVALKSYPVREKDDHLQLNLKPVGAAAKQTETTYTFRVVSNKNVATFIKELVLEPLPGTPLPTYQPGDYMQLDIPVYASRTLQGIAVEPPFAAVWQTQHVYDFETENPLACRRNYSLATNPATDRLLRFNVRIATPPRGQHCNAGVGSTYVFSLKPGDTVTAIGPFGDFHIRPGEREMVYLGGGAGMAPLRAHIANLLETQGSQRRISYWYGARSLQELFYQDYFADLARRFPNFTFNVALSEPLPSDNWRSHTGFIHEVLLEQYLSQHPDPKQIDFYLCGPPAMIKAAKSMLKDLGIAPSQIASDEY